MEEVVSGYHQTNPQARKRAGKPANHLHISRNRWVARQIIPREQRAGSHNNPMLPDF